MRVFFVEVKVLIVQKTFVLVKVFLVKLPLHRTTCIHVVLVTAFFLVQKTFVLV